MSLQRKGLFVILGEAHIRQKQTAAREHAGRKIEADNIVVTGAHKLGERSAIAATEVEDEGMDAYVMAREPVKAKRVRETTLMRHAIPKAYRRWEDSRRVHGSKINTRKRDSSTTSRAPQSGEKQKRAGLRSE